MKTITKYQSNDGSVFNTAEECQKYDELINQVEEIMKPFGKLPNDKGCVFANGGGYIQHNPQAVEIAKTELMNLGKKFLNIKSDVSAHFIGRYFDDSGNSVLYSAWNRLHCCDSLGREWGQQYYAMNPNTGVQKPYNALTPNP